MELFGAVIEEIERLPWLSRVALGAKVMLFNEAEPLKVHDPPTPKTKAQDGAVVTSPVATG